MLSLFARSELSDIIEKVEQGKRIEYEDGVRLINSKDILALGYMANLIRERKNKDHTYFSVSHSNNSIQAGTSALNSLSLEDYQAQALNVAGGDWFETQRTAQAVEKRSYAVMLYGDNVKAEDRIKDLLELRSLQDETQGFLTFIPLPVYPKEMSLEGLMGVQSTTGFEDLRMLSVSRILLDNFDHIKAFWVLLGVKLAQVSLNFGVDDLDGKLLDDRKDAEASTSDQAMTVKTLVKMIHKAGRQAIERDSLYQVLKDYGRERGSL